MRRARANSADFCHTRITLFRLRLSLLSAEQMETRLHARRIHSFPTIIYKFTCVSVGFQADDYMDSRF